MPPAPTAEQFVRNEVLLRDINERIVELLKAQPDLSMNGDHRTDFLCECSQEGCTETVSLRLDEYEGVRSSPTVFVVLPGHETPQVEDTLLTNERFSLVEKKTFVELAVTTDPRAG